MSKPRFFAFGCSMTHFQWLTWADILAMHYAELGYDTYNLGISGSGNQQILSTLARADLKYNFTDADIICVMWSSWSRLDMYTRFGSSVRNEKNEIVAKWNQGGNILMLADNLDPEEIQAMKSYQKYIRNMNHDLIRNITAIHTANRAYRIAYNGSIWNTEGPGHGKIVDEEFDRVTRSMPEHWYYNPYDHHDSWSAETWNFYNIVAKLDGHPVPGAALQWVTDVIAPEMNIQLSDSVSERVRQFEGHCANYLTQFVELHTGKGLSGKFHNEVMGYLHDYTNQYRSECGIKDCEELELWMCPPSGNKPAGNAEPLNELGQQFKSHYSKN